MDVDQPVGQRTPDETTVRRQATVNTVDEALTWVARQLDILNIVDATVQFECTPMLSYTDDGEPAAWFEVAVGGVVAEEVETDDDRS